MSIYKLYVNLGLLYCNIKIRIQLRCAVVIIFSEAAKKEKGKFIFLLIKLSQVTKRELSYKHIQLYPIKLKKKKKKE